MMRYIHHLASFGRRLCEANVCSPLFLGPSEKRLPHSTTRMVDIAAKIAASKKKMEQQEREAKEREIEKELEDQALKKSRAMFLRTTSDPGPPRSPSAHGGRAPVTIFDVVKTGDLATLERMRLKSPSILTETDSTGSRPVHHAARNGRVEVLKHLDTIDPMLLHARNDTGMTVLHFAVQNSHKSNRKECLGTLRFILERTNPDTVFAAADTDCSGELSYEELEAAYGHVIGPSLLKKVFRKVDTDRSGEISLDEFKKALEAGTLTPLTLMKDSTGSTACHIACQRSNQIAVQFFAKYVPDIMNIRDKEGRMPVHVLAFNGSIETLKAIAKKDKAPLEQKDFINATLVHHASANGQEDTIKYLIEELSEDILSATDRNGANPAHWAARSNKLGVLRLIAGKMPALLMSKNRDGKTPKDMCFSDDVKSFLSGHEITRATSDPGSHALPPVRSANAQWATNAAKNLAHTTEKIVPNDQILPPMGKGKSLAELMAEKRTQRL